MNKRNKILAIFLSIVLAMIIAFLFIINYFNIFTFNVNNNYKNDVKISHIKREINFTPKDNFTYNNLFTYKDLTIKDSKELHKINPELKKLDLIIKKYNKETKYQLNLDYKDIVFLYSLDENYQGFLSKEEIARNIDDINYLNKKNIKSLRYLDKTLITRKNIDKINSEEKIYLEYNNNNNNNLSKKTFKVIFDTKTNNELKEDLREEGTKLLDIVKNIKPEKEGYTFNSWLLYNTKLTENDTLKQDITLTASYSVNKYKIEFQVEEGTKLDPITLEYNSNILDNIRDKKTQRKYFRFLNWTLDGKDIVDQRIKNNIVLLPKYDEEPIKINIKGYPGYKVSGRYNMEIMSFIGNIKPEKEGYTFMSWNIPNNVKILKEEITVEPIFEETKHVITLINSLNNQTIKEIKVKHSSDLYTSIKDEVFDIDNHFFIGWTEKNDSEELITEKNTKKVTENIAIYTKIKRGIKISIKPDDRLVFTERNTLKEGYYLKTEPRYYFNILAESKSSYYSIIGFKIFEKDKEAFVNIFDEKNFEYINGYEHVSINDSFSINLQFSFLSSNDNNDLTFEFIFERNQDYNQFLKVNYIPPAENGSHREFHFKFYENSIKKAPENLLLPRAYKVTLERASIYDQINNEEEDKIKKIDARRVFNFEILNSYSEDTDISYYNLTEVIANNFSTGIKAFINSKKTIKFNVEDFGLAGIKSFKNTTIEFDKGTYFINIHSEKFAYQNCTILNLNELNYIETFKKYHKYPDN